MASLNTASRYPEGVDSENVKASCEDGVLEVTLPKLVADKKKKSKQIKVT